jgi:hypothetical protein
MLLLVKLSHIYFKLRVDLYCSQFAYFIHFNGEIQIIQNKLLIMKEKT